MTFKKLQRHTQLRLTIDTALSAVKPWSEAGFHAFFTSGIFKDLLEVVDSKIPLDERYLYSCPQSAEMFMPASDWGTVTQSQFLEFLKSVPVAPSEKFDQFIDVFKPWHQTAGWWERNTLSQNARNEWRHVMGLTPLYPFSTLSNP